MVLRMYMNNSPRTMVLYVSRVGLRGSRVTPPFITSRPWLMEVMNCSHSGYRVMIIIRNRKMLLHTTKTLRLRPPSLIGIAFIPPYHSEVSVVLREIQLVAVTNTRLTRDWNSPTAVA